MRPTKRTQATKKESNPVLDKLMKLKYRITGMIEKVGEDHKQKANKDWIIKQIKLVRHDVKMTASSMKIANKLWYAYRYESVGDYYANRGHSEYTI